MLLLLGKRRIEGWSAACLGIVQKAHGHEKEEIETSYAERALLALGNVFTNGLDLL